MISDSFNLQSAICNSTDGPGPIEWIINQERAAEHQALGHQAPGAAVGTGRAVIAQAQEMPGLDVHGREIQAAQRRPLGGIAPGIGPVSVGRFPLLSVVRVAPEPEVAHLEASALAADAGRLPVVFPGATALL